MHAHKNSDFLKIFLIFSYEETYYTGAMTAGEHKSLALIYINTLAQIWLEKFKEFCLNKTNGMHIMIAINSLNSSKIRSTRSAMHGSRLSLWLCKLTNYEAKNIKASSTVQKSLCMKLLLAHFKDIYSKYELNICFWYDLNLKSHALLVYILKGQIWIIARIKVEIFTI